LTAKSLFSLQEPDQGGGFCNLHQDVTGFPPKTPFVPAERNLPVRLILMYLELQVNSKPGSSNTLQEEYTETE